MAIPPDKAKENIDAIIEGLKPGNRVAFDIKGHKFVQLDKNIALKEAKTDHSQYITELVALERIIKDFIKDKQQVLKPADITKVKAALEDRAKNLEERTTGIFGWLISWRVSPSAKLLRKIENKVKEASEGIFGINKRF